MRNNVYNAIVDYVKQNGYAPSYREIASMVGLRSICSVQFHIKKLADAGMLELGGTRRARAIKVVGANSREMES